MLLQWLGDNAWAVWLILAGGLAVSEMLTLDLTLLMLASGALAGAVTAFFLPGPLAAQVAVAIVVALTMLFVTRPALLKRLRSSPGYRSSTSNILGASGTAVGEITASGGEVRIGGDVWSARSYDASVIGAGTEVDVLEVDGLTALVYPKHKPLTG